MDGSASTADDGRLQALRTREAQLISDVLRFYREDRDAAVLMAAVRELRAVRDQLHAADAEAPASGFHAR